VADRETHISFPLRRTDGYGSERSAHTLLAGGPRIIITLTPFYLLNPVEPVTVFTGLLLLLWELAFAK